MQLFKNIHKSAVKLISLTACVSVAVGLQIAIFTGFLSRPGAAGFNTITAVCITLISLFTSGTIIGAITAIIDPIPARLLSIVCSQALAVLAASTSAQHVGQINSNAHFWIMLIMNLLFSYGLTTIITTYLRIDQHLKLSLRIGVPSIIAMGGIVGLLGRSWLSLETLTQNLAIIRDFALLGAPVVLLLGLSPLKMLLKNPRQWWDLLILRMPIGAQNLAAQRTLKLCAAGLLMNMFLRILGKVALNPAADDMLNTALEAVSLGWIGCLYASFSNVTSLTYEQQQSQMTAKLATFSARRFLRRHADDRQHWAAIVGLKTTNYVIDHDAESKLYAALPASILQIRSEEIKRCVNDVLGPLNLHNQASSHRVAGAIDPEKSIRPCIDTLKMFACIYLDGGPLVERRFKGLVSLLPIIDPDLARQLKPDLVSALINRTKWFFHFDFAWLDQHMTHSPNGIRYDVQLATLPDQTRLAMLDYMEKTGGIGNVVWLGPDARNRLLQEAPSMASIIETCPIPAAPGTRDTDEMLMFVIKFEQLIPRLQRHFDFEQGRQSLTDFDFNPESTRIHRMLSLQLNKSAKYNEIMQVLAQVTSVPWRGFKEKDTALQLILATHDRLSKLLTPGGVLSDSSNPSAIDAQQRLLHAVRAIGYPSQILHHSQLNKLALRYLDKLISVASNPESSRFQEAWLLLSTADYQRFSADQRAQILKFLIQSAENPRINRLPITQRKAVDALAGIGSIASSEDRPGINAGLAKLYDWFLSLNIDTDLLCLLLDAHLFLETKLKAKIDLPDSTKREFQSRLGSITLRLGLQHHQVTALQSRWQELQDITTSSKLSA